jgi:hypothetical protein
MLQLHMHHPPLRTWLLVDQAWTVPQLIRVWRAACCQPYRHAQMESVHSLCCVVLYQHCRSTGLLLLAAAGWCSDVAQLGAGGPAAGRPHTWPHCSLGDVQCCCCCSAWLLLLCVAATVAAGWCSDVAQLGAGGPATGRPNTWSHCTPGDVQCCCCCLLLLLLLQVGAQTWLSWVQEGLLLDDRTRGLTARLVTYNAVLKVFADIQVAFDFQAGGSIKVRRGCSWAIASLQAACAAPRNCSSHRRVHVQSMCSRGTCSPWCMEVE